MKTGMFRRMVGLLTAALAMNRTTGLTLPPWRGGSTSYGPPNVRSNKRYRGRDRVYSRAQHDRNFKINEERRKAARAKLAALQGNGIGYTYRHHDELVRKFGARITRHLERQMRDAGMTFQQALAYTAEAA